MNKKTRNETSSSSRITAAKLKRNRQKLKWQKEVVYL